MPRSRRILCLDRTSFSWTFLWIVVHLDRRVLDGTTMFTWTRIGSAYIRLDGRGSNRRTFSWTRIGSAYEHTYTHIHTHIHTHSYIYKLNIISLYINSLKKLTSNLHQIKYHNLQFMKFTHKNVCVCLCVRR